jgi:hypothetical protein
LVEILEVNCLDKKITLSLVATLSIFSLLIISNSLVFAQPPGGRPVGPRDPTHTVYVTSQNKYYDTIVPIPPDKGLPWNEHNTGSFQLIDNGETEFGPGDPGYRGGRWWVDDGDGIQEDPDYSDDFYFLCPLLGPGRENP